MNLGVITKNEKSLDKDAFELYAQITKTNTKLFAQRKPKRDNIRKGGGRLD